ncbi:MAG: NAD(P)-dependent oxidoreductase [Candidatus Baltobacteraceae bacterium]|jgi:citronellol/citronellal dehydrogenase
MDLRGKTLFVTGASRGIGLAIALRAARDGANVAVVAKTTEAHPKLPGTIYTAAEEIERTGGRALALACDIRLEEQVEAAAARTAEAFGGIDVCVNNASAIALTPTLKTEMKRYDLMNGVNVRGTFLCSKATIPYLKRSANPHILNLSPPLDMRAKWFAPHVAYTIAKFGMSLCTLGMAEELRADGIAVNSLWPLTTIDTAAVRNLLGGAPLAEASRSPEIVADAAYAILTKSSRECSGNFFIDEELLRAEGVSDFSRYSAVPQEQLFADFFVPDEVFERIPTKVRKPLRVATF